MIPEAGSPLFDRVGIVGLGLMGGSLARGLKALPAPPFIRALSEDPRDLEQGLEAGVIDEAPDDPKAFFEGLDLVVYCTPLEATLDLLTRHRGFLAPGTLITDVVSLKTPILEKIRALHLQSTFVGCHPMAGGEGSGFSASRTGLFTDSKVWIVADGAPQDSVRRMQAFWASLGAEGAVVEASDHDAMMVWVSHLPQITANALALALGTAGFERHELGPGGKDMTRLAGSVAGMWQGLFRYAPPNLPEALEALESALGEIRTLIQEAQGDEVAQVMRRTRDWFEGAKWN